MKRWRTAAWKDGKLVREDGLFENSKIDAFLEEIMAVCEKHGFSIGHEDGHGAFEIYSGTTDKGWIKYAHDCTDVDE